MNRIGEDESYSVSGLFFNQIVLATSDADKLIHSVYYNIIVYLKIMAKYSNRSVVEQVQKRFVGVL